MEPSKLADSEILTEQFKFPTGIDMEDAIFSMSTEEDLFFVAKPQLQTYESLPSS